MVSWKRTSSFSVGVDRLLEEPYSIILCYPRPSFEELGERVEELKRLGVEVVVFEGRTSLSGLKVLGKGNVGLVVRALHKGKCVALKVRRVDSRRERMKREAEMLSYANSLGVGPRLISYSKNFIVMELVEGKEVEEWVKNCGRRELKVVLPKLLDQCFKLDGGGLDHGELSNPKKHVLISGDKSFILDFERASLNRRPSNLTSLVQYFFVGGPYSDRVRRMLGVKVDEVIEALRAYKADRSRSPYEKVLRALRLRATS